MKIGIVSCYGEGEANSAYSKTLVEEFTRQGHFVEILRLPFSIFYSNSSDKMRMGDSIIDEFSRKIRDFDYVSIQYESALYGCSLSTSLKRVMKLIYSCKEKAFSITIHNTTFLRSSEKKRKGLKRFFYKVKNVSFGCEAKFTSLLKQVRTKNGLVIVHSLETRNKILGLVADINIIMHPLNYKRKEDIEKIKKDFSKEEYIKEKGLDKIDFKKAIGVLGTIVGHKDYVAIIKALKFLPKDYHLFIYGGQHSLSYIDQPNGLQQTKDLECLIENLDLSERVHFMGFQSDGEEMLKGHLFCDYIVLPHVEIGESASASLGNALELTDYVFATRNNMFDSVKVFTGEAFWQYDMGNYMELAEKILRLPDIEKIKKQRENYLDKYNITENVKLYLSVFDNK